MLLASHCTRSSRAGRPEQAPWPPVEQARYSDGRRSSDTARLGEQLTSALPVPTQPLPRSATRGGLPLPGWGRPSPAHAAAGRVRIRERGSAYGRTERAPLASPPPIPILQIENLVDAIECVQRCLELVRLPVCGRSSAPWLSPQQLGGLQYILRPPHGETTAFAK